MISSSPNRAMCSNAKFIEYLISIVFEKVTNVNGIQAPFSILFDFHLCRKRGKKTATGDGGCMEAFGHRIASSRLKHKELNLFEMPAAAPLSASIHSVLCSRNHHCGCMRPRIIKETLPSNK